MSKTFSVPAQHQGGAMIAQIKLTGPKLVTTLSKQNKSNADACPHKSKRVDAFVRLKRESLKKDVVDATSIELKKRALRPVYEQDGTISDLDPRDMYKVKGNENRSRNKGKFVAQCSFQAAMDMVHFLPHPHGPFIAQGFIGPDDETIRNFGCKIAECSATVDAAVEQLLPRLDCANDNVKSLSTAAFSANEIFPMHVERFTSELSAFNVTLKELTERIGPYVRPARAVANATEACVTTARGFKESCSGFFEYFGSLFPGLAGKLDSLGNGIECASYAMFASVLVYFLWRKKYKSIPMLLAVSSCLFLFGKKKALFELLQQKIHSFIMEAGTMRAEYSGGGFISNETIAFCAKVISVLSAAVLGVKYSWSMTNLGTARIISDLTKIGREGRWLSDGIEGIISMIEKVVNWFRYAIFGLDPVHLIQRATTDTEYWRCRAEAMLKKFRIEGIVANVNDADYTAKLVDEGRLLIAMAKGADLAPVRAIVEAYLRPLEKSLEPLAAMTCEKGRMRVAPFVLLMKSGPGTGKSTITQAINAHTIKQLVPVECHEHVNFDIGNHVYVRNSNCAHFDGYGNQPITIIDDWMQKVDVKGSETSEALDLINLKNEMPYMLPQASLATKGQVYFTSALIMLTTNIVGEIRGIESIRDVDAIRRRIDLSVVLKVKPEYQVKSTIQGSLAQRLNTDHPDIVNSDELFTKCYLFDIYDESTGEKVKSDLDFDAFMELYTLKFQEHRKKSAALLSKTARFTWNSDKSERPLENLGVHRDFKAQMLNDGEKEPQMFSDLDRVVVAASEDPTESEPFLSVLRERLGSQWFQLWHRVQSIDMRSIMDFVKKDLPTYPLHCVKRFCDEMLEGAGLNLASALTLPTHVAGFYFWLSPITGWTKGMINVLGAIAFLLVIQSGLIRWIESANYIWRCGVNHDTPYVMTENEDRVYGYASGMAACLGFVGRKTAGLRKYFFKLVRESDFPDAASTYDDCVEFCKGRVRKPVIYSYLVKYNVAAELDTHRQSWKNWLISIYDSTLERASLSLASTLRKLLKIVAWCGATVGTVALAKLAWDQFESQGELKGESEDYRSLKERRERHAQPRKFRWDNPHNAKTAQFGAHNTRNMEEKLDVCLYDFALASDERNGFAFAITRDFYLIPYHFVMQIAKKMDDGAIDAQDVVTLANRVGNIYECRVADVLSGKGAPELDCWVFRTGQVPHNKDNLGLFPERKEIEYDQFCEGALHVRAGGKDTVLVSHFEPAFDQQFVLENVAAVNVRHAWLYRAPTKSGYCGSPLIARHGKRKTDYVVGIHVAGRESRFCRSTDCLAAIVTKEDLQDYIAAFDDCESAVPNQLMAQSYSCDPNDVMEIRVTTNPVPCKYVGDFKTLAFTGPHVSTPPGSNLVRSHLMPEDWPSVKRPAKLAPFAAANCYIIPRTLAIEKYGVRGDICVDGHTLQACCDDYFRLMKDLIHMKKPDLSPITIEMACSGIPGEEFCHGISRSSSAGYPYVAYPEVKKAGGKKAFFGDGEYFHFTSDSYKKLESDLSKMEEEIISGRRPLVIYNDVLKDELRAPEKVDAGKTRLVSASPLHNTICYRKYMARLGAFIMRSRFDLETALGINVWSDEWQDLRNHLCSNSPHIVAGDFSGFDTSQNAIIHKMIAEGLIDCLQADAYVAKIVRALHVEIYQSRHYSEGAFYEWNGSLPSGHPWTVILNSIYVCIVMRVAWVTSGHNLSDFRKHVRLISYGDDSIMSVSKSVLPTFNQNVISEQLAKVAMIYTDESKSSNGYLDSRAIDEVTFLKRDFHAHLGLGRIVGGLELGTILEMPCWYSKKRDMTENLRERCTEAVIELYIKGDSYWDKYAEVIIQRFFNKFGENLVVHTRATARMMLLERFN